MKVGKPTRTVMTFAAGIVVGILGASALKLGSCGVTDTFVHDVTMTILRDTAAALMEGSEGAGP